MRFAEPFLFEKLRTREIKHFVEIFQVTSLFYLIKFIML